jgi:hypothetical protein
MPTLSRAALSLVLAGEKFSVLHQLRACMETAHIQKRAHMKTLQALLYLFSLACLISMSARNVEPCTTDTDCAEKHCVTAQCAADILD